MKQKHFAALATASVLALSAGAASATIVHFDLGHGDSAYNQSSLHYSEGGLDLTLTGASCGTWTCRDEDIDRYSGSGVGMNRSYWDSHTVDGYGRNEYINLEFSHDVQLKSVTFSYVTQYSDFVLYTWDGSGWNYVGEADADQGTYNFAGTYDGSIFSIGAAGAHDSWKLAGVSAHYVAPIPLPAAGWMLLAGIGGIAAMKRRKKAAV